jgi:hypothetical protein
MWSDEARKAAAEARATHQGGVDQIGRWRSAAPAEFLAAREQSPMSAMFTPHQPEDLAGHTLFMNPEGTVGAAVSPSGDIQSVFNNSGIKGAGGAAVDEAINRGGRTLDAFGDKLASIYEAHGFKETGRVKFDPAQAPPTWDTTKYGRPDVVFMKLKDRR